MHNNTASSPLSLGQHLDNNTTNTSGRKYLSKLGKFLGCRAASTANTTQQSSEFSYSTPAFPLNNHLTIPIPSAHLSCLDDEEIGTLKSDKDLGLDFPHNRVLNHSVSAPTLCLHSLSEASTRCPTPTSGGVKSSTLKVPLRSCSLPTTLDRKSGPTTDPKPKSRQRWNSKLLKGNKHWRSSSILLRTPPATSQPSIIAASPLEAAFVPTPPLSTIFPVDTQNLLDPMISSGSRMPDDMDSDALSNLNISRRRSINKLARMLSVAPRDFEPTTTPFLVGPSRPDTATRSRSMSLPLNTTFIGTPSVLRSRQKSRSRTSLSTSNADDLHHFDLTDDLSDNWGEMRSGSRASIYSSNSPISPIIFNPPTPITTRPPPQPLHLTENMKLEEVSLPSSPYPHVHTTLNRSRSMTLAPVRSKLVASAHAAGSSSDTSPLPIKASWLGSMREEVSTARNFVVAHPEYIDEYRTWSGQWNQNSIPDTIKMLRTQR